MRASNFINIKAQGMLKDYYKVGKLISNGEFGEARKVKRQDNPEEWRVANTMSKNVMSDEETQKLFNEINILKQLDHPNIVRAYELLEDSKSYNFITE